MTFKKNILPALIITAIGILIFTATPVSANTKADATFSGLVQFISQKFGLDQSKVQSAFDEYKEQRKSEKVKSLKQAWLDKLVKQGKITSSQKTEILKELEVLKTKYSPEKMKDLSREEQQKQYAAAKAEIKAWSEKTGIDAKYLMPGFSGFGFKGLHKGFLKPVANPTPNQ